MYQNTVDSLVTQMQISGLTNGDMYYFKVTATNLVGESSDSSPTSALAAVTPSAPSMPQIVSQTSTQITFSWFEPSNGGSNIDDYQVFVCRNELLFDCSFELLASTTGGLKQYSATSLTKGQTYQFKVRAHNSIGYGAYSDVLSAVAADKPSQPNPV